jgi:hypothetical protein
MVSRIVIVISCKYFSSCVSHKSLGIQNQTIDTPGLLVNKLWSRYFNLKSTPPVVTITYFSLQNMSHSATRNWTLLIPTQRHSFMWFETPHPLLLTEIHWALWCLILQKMRYLMAWMFVHTDDYYVTRTANCSRIPCHLQLPTCASMCICSVAMSLAQQLWPHLTVRNIFRDLIT